MISKSEAIRDAFRRWGFLQADLDPLDRLPPIDVPELEVSGRTVKEARNAYCGTLAAEFMHLPDSSRREWIRERMEGDPPETNPKRVLRLLARAEIFEQVLQLRYMGAKRFSLEGSASLIPCLAELADSAGEEIVLGTSHRGRLNVMVQIVGKPPADVLTRFEDLDPHEALGAGDVRYHVGASGTWGKNIHVTLVSNPSHVEAVDPVVLGRARAKQKRSGLDRVLSIVVHGDAGFAGQGIAAETLNLANLEGYTVGGTVHVVVNNLVGYTTTPDRLHSSRFAASVAARIPVPVFHVNGEDPDAVVRAARLAAGYRTEFASDVVIDIIGYRVWGHSEVDDPTVTQPVLYRKIKKRGPLWSRYAERIGWKDADGLKSELEREFKEAQEEAEKSESRPDLFTLPDYWSSYHGGAYDAAEDPETGVVADDLETIGERITNASDGFQIHEKVERGLRQRREMARGKRAVDWGAAEAFAFGSLLQGGIPVRMSGQDSRRGTFNQRHAVWFDTRSEKEHVPLAALAGNGAWFEIHDSPLSEASVLGFEYGFSRDYPEALVVWEAQYGDFANGAQVIFDQFLSSGEDKWGLLSGLTVLLPHGFEGQGPEHSSARMERFLQLAAEDNIQIAQPSTSAQYFHLLRRQVLRKWRKPLIVFTPKSLLRRPEACSDRDELTSGRFRPVLPDDRRDAVRVLLCTGKIAHDLRKARREEAVAVVALEQLYPFPEAELQKALDPYPNAAVVWVQEEPANMGALAFVRPRIETILGGRPVLSVKRAESASPATGSAAAHRIEQERLIEMAFWNSPAVAGETRS